MAGDPQDGRLVVTAAPGPGTVLCRLDELGDPGGRGFSFEPPHTFEMFVVRKGRQVFGYVNDCPHTHATLDWVPNQFLDYTRTQIQCSTHGAEFRIEDGFCTWGPCKGESLTPVAVTVRDGEVVIA